MGFINEIRKIQKMVFKPKNDSEYPEGLEMSAADYQKQYTAIEILTAAWLRR